jgi:hypothetical protein
MKRLIINTILYPIYSWQGTWSHVHGLSSNQIPTIFSAVAHSLIITANEPIRSLEFNLQYDKIRHVQLICIIGDKCYKHAVVNAGGEDHIPHKFPFLKMMYTNKLGIYSWFSFF